MVKLLMLLIIHKKHLLTQATLGHFKYPRSPIYGDAFLKTFKRLTNKFLIPSHSSTLSITVKVILKGLKATIFVVLCVHLES